MGKRKGWGKGIWRAGDEERGSGKRGKKELVVGKSWIGMCEGMCGEVEDIVCGKIGRD
jgi:hypothetical protein